MTDEYNKRAYERLQQEIAEHDNPRARYQAQLDRMMWERRDAMEEERRLRQQLDPFNYGHWK